MPGNHDDTIAEHAKRLRIIRRMLRRLSADVTADRRLAQKSHDDTQQIVNSTAEIRTEFRNLKNAIDGRGGWQQKSTRMETTIEQLDEFRRDQKALNLKLFLAVIFALVGALWSVLMAHWPIAK